MNASKIAALRGLILIKLEELQKEWRRSGQNRLRSANLASDPAEKQALESTATTLAGCIMDVQKIVDELRVSRIPRQSKGRTSRPV